MNSKEVIFPNSVALVAPPVLSRMPNEDLNLSYSSSVADPRCLSRIQLYPSRIQVDNIPDPDPHKKTDTKFSKIRIPDPGSGFFFHPGSRFQGSKQDWIADPQHCLIQMKADPEPSIALNYHTS